MKKGMVLYSLLCFWAMKALAQNVGIGTNTPHVSAMLDISSNNRGLLPPRMTAAQRIGIASPENGLLVYDTDSAAIMVRSAGVWRKLSSSSGGDLWQPSGNNIFSGNSGYVGIGVNDPLFKLDVKGRMLIRGDGSLMNLPGVIFTNKDGSLYTGLVGTQSDSLLGMFGVGNNIPNNGWGLNMNVYNGRVGIGTNSANAALHVADSAVLFSGLNTNTLYPGIAPPVQGPGIRMLWYPQKAAFRAGFAGANTWDRDNIGNHSFAGGQATLAKGRSSTAFGLATEALGDFSTATGIYTRTLAFGSTAVGAYNNMDDNPNPISSAQEDRIFQLGNGTSSTRSNALTVLRNGNTGIGTTNPTARLHIQDSAVLFTGSNSEPPVTTTINPPALGAGTRMMWVPALGAFRAGYVGSDEWNRDNIGRLSFATGFNSRASGEYAVSMGRQNIAAGFSSLSLGNQNNAQGTSSVCIGATNFAGLAGIAIGEGNVAFSQGAVAVGATNNAFGNYSFAAGFGTYAKAYGGSSIGSYNDNDDTPDPENPASTDRIFQVGNGTFNAGSNAITVLRNANVGIGTTLPAYALSFPNTLGDKISLWGNSGPHYGLGIQGSLLQIHSATQSDGIAFGYGSSNAFNERAKIINDGEFGMSLAGRLQLKTGTQSAGLWLTNNSNSSNNAFIGMRSDTEVGFFGQTGTPSWRYYVNTTSGNAWLQGTLTQNSDARLKTNIVPLSNTLEAIDKLNGYTYNWKDASNPDEQIGLLAQEVQKVFPVLVKENSDGNLGVNYSGMVPVLLQAIKEQQLQIEELKQLVKQLLKK